jgi:hypothetical protein
LDAFAATTKNRKPIEMEWTNQQRNELYYYVNRACRLVSQYGDIQNDPRVIADALEDILSPDHDGDDVIRATKCLIKEKGRVPLPSEIGRFLDERHV